MMVDEAGHAPDMPHLPQYLWFQEEQLRGVQLATSSSRYGKCKLKDGRRVNRPTKEKEDRWRPG